MIAAQFLSTTTKVRLNAVPRNENDPTVTAAIHFCGLAGRELADILIILNEKGLISSKDLGYFADKIAGKDMDIMWQTAKETGMTKEWNEDFEQVQRFFADLASESLSEFQKKSDPDLQMILSAIYIIEYSIRAIWKINAAKSKIPNANIQRILAEKLTELKDLFERRYKRNANFPFNFNLLAHKYKRLLKLNYKQMKKAMILIIALSGVAIQAQTASVSLKVKLTPIISISVSQPAVTINVDTEQKYLQGAETSISDHIRTFSTVGYKVTVKSLNPTLSKSDDAIDLDKVTITASSSFPHATYTPATLSEAGALLIESTKGGGQKRHNVTYSIGTGLWDNEMGEYSATVQYEIVAI